MSLYDSRAGGISEDWSVILQSVSAKQKKALVKRVAEIFEIDKKDAEQALANLPLILLDNLTFGMAARIKNYFQKLGAVVETTNHDMIKKNCFQVVWPDVPDLSFFLKDEVLPLSKAPEPPPAPNIGFSLFKKTTPEEPPKENPPVAPVSETVPTEAHKAEPPSVNPVVDPAWEQRAKELSERLQKIQQEKITAEKKEIVEKADLAKAEETGKASQNEEIARLQEELQQTIRSKEFLQRDCEEFKGKIRNLEAQISEMERSLSQKTLALELAAKEKEDRTPAEGLVSKEDHESEIASREEEILSLQARVQELSLHGSSLEKDVAEKNRALNDARAECQLLQQQKKDLEEKLSAYETKLREVENLLTISQKEIETLQHQEKDLSTKTGHADFKLTELQAALEHAQKEAQASLLHEKEITAKLQGSEQQLQEAQSALEAARFEVQALQKREQDLLDKREHLERHMYDKDEGLKSRDAALAELEQKVAELLGKTQEFERIQKEHAALSQERASIRSEYESKIADQAARLTKLEEEHRRYRSRMDRKNAAATRELGEWARAVDTLRQGLQKLTVFLGSQALDADPDKKNSLRSPLNRNVKPNGPTTGPGPV